MLVKDGVKNKSTSGVVLMMFHLQVKMLNHQNSPPSVFYHTGNLKFFQNSLKVKTFLLQLTVTLSVLLSWTLKRSKVKILLVLNQQLVFQSNIKLTSLMVNQKFSTREFSTKISDLFVNEVFQINILFVLVIIIYSIHGTYKTNY